ncbi:protein SCO1 homolog 2, mitochondrial [Tanacetum coccineum]
MIPHKAKCGAAVVARLKVYEGVLTPYNRKKRMVIPDALKYVTPGRTVIPRMFHSSSYIRSTKKGSTPLLTTTQKQSAPPLLRLRNYLIPAAVFGGIGLGLLFMHYNDDKRAIRQGQCKNDGCSSRNGPVIGGPFKLIDPNGKLATDKDHKGNWTLLQFGYTSSPDVGSVELSKLTKAIKTLPSSDSKQNLKVQPVFVTLDPQRDILKFDVAKAGRKRFMIFADKSVLKVHIPEVLPDVVKEECLILVTTNVNEETGTIEIKQETVKEKIHDKKEDDITKRKKDVSQYSTMDTVLDESTIDFEPQEYIIPSSSSTILLKQTLILKRRYEIISLLDGVSLHEYASSGLKPTCENDVLCRNDLAIWNLEENKKICHAPSLDDMIAFRNEDILSLIQRTSLRASNRASNNRFSWKHWMHNLGELNIS